MIKSRGGAAIVQNPAEALYPGMPASAIANVPVDAVVSSDRIAETIVRLVSGRLDPVDPVSDPGPADLPQAPVRDLSTGPAGSGANGHPVTPTCPECGGVLEDLTEAGVSQWRCRVGHRYSPESLADAHGEGVEGALWAAIRTLEDREDLLRRMAGQLDAHDNHRSARSFRRRADEAAGQARSVRAVVADTAATTAGKVSDSEAVQADREVAS